MRGETGLESDCGLGELRGPPAPPTDAPSAVLWLRGTGAIVEAGCCWLVLIDEWCW